MSKIASMWLFKGDHEYPYPYVKRTNTTKSTTLGIDGWSLWFSGRINEIVSVVGNGLWMSSQLQVLGGPNSMLLRNADGSTAYTMRDATIGGTWDAFCQGTQDAANSWQCKNDVGSLIRFSKVDRRLL